MASTPEKEAALAKARKRRERSERLTGWMNHIPVVGRLVYVFWYSLLDDGLIETCKPRWGALTFSFLNDGMRPTVWHTWRQITRDQYDQFTGIYTRGAPKSLAQAREWKWKREEELQLHDVRRQRALIDYIDMIEEESHRD